MFSSEQSITARHEYGMKAWYRSLLLILGACAVSGGIAVSVVVVRTSGSTLPSVMALLFLGFGTYLLLVAQRSRVIIEGDRIEVRGAFADRDANLNEIEGYRTISERNGKYTQIYMNSGQPRSLYRIFSITMMRTTRGFESFEISIIETGTHSSKELKTKKDSAQLLKNGWQLFRRPKATASSRSSLQ